MAGGLVESPGALGVRGQRGGDTGHAPGAAEVESIEVNDLVVRPVRNGGRFEQVVQAGRGQVAAEPGRESRCGQDAAHQVRDFERRGEKIGSVGFLSMAMSISWTKAAATMFTIYMTLSNLGHVAGNFAAGWLREDLSLSYEVCFAIAGVVTLAPLALLPLVQVGLATLVARRALGQALAARS